MQFWALSFLELKNSIAESFKPRIDLMLSYIDTAETCDRELKGRMRAILNAFRDMEAYKDITELISELNNEITITISAYGEDCNLLTFAKYSIQIVKMERLLCRLSDAFGSHIEKCNGLIDQAMENSRYFTQILIQLNLYTESCNYSYNIFISSIRRAFNFVPRILRADIDKVLRLDDAARIFHVKYSQFVCALDHLETEVLKSSPLEMQEATLILFAKIRNFLKAKGNKLGSVVLNDAFDEYLSIASHPCIDVLKLILTPCSTAGILLVNPLVKKPMEPEEADLKQFDEMLNLFPLQLFIKYEQTLTVLIENSQGQLLNDLQELKIHLVNWHKEILNILEERESLVRIRLFFELMNRIIKKLQQFEFEIENEDTITINASQFFDSVCDLLYSFASYMDGFSHYGNELSLLYAPPKIVAKKSAAGPTPTLCESFQHKQLHALDTLVSQIPETEAIINIREGYIPILEELLYSPQEVLREHLPFVLSKLALLLEQALNHFLNKQGIPYKKDHNLNTLLKLCGIALPSDLAEIVSLINGFNSTKYLYSDLMNEKAQLFSENLYEFHQKIEILVEFVIDLISKVSGPLEPHKPLKTSIKKTKINFSVELDGLEKSIDKISRLFNERKLIPVGSKALFLRTRQISNSIETIQSSVARIKRVSLEFSTLNVTTSLNSILLNLASLMEQSEKLLLALSHLEENNEHILKARHQGRPIRYCHDPAFLFTSVRKSYKIKLSSTEAQMLSDFSLVIGHHSRYPGRSREKSLSEMQQRVFTLRKRNETVGLKKLIEEQLPKMARIATIFTERLLFQVS